MRNFHLIALSTSRLEEDPSMSPSQSPGTVMGLDEAYRIVIQILAQHESMPFLELTSLCDIGDDDLKRIIRDLQERDMVKVTNADDILEEIITLRERGFAVAAA